MTFVSIQFLIFFTVVFTLFYSVKKRFRVAVLFLASMFFLASFSIPFLVYALVFTLLNFIVGKALARYSGKKRKNIYYAGQIFNIGGLVFYKYINFILENVNYSLSLFSSSDIPYLNILVPVGISYYTFQGISYLYLIYKAKDKPEDNFCFFGLYMIFFPKLLAGPIERHRVFLPQINRYKGIDISDITIGVRLFLWGALKKTVIADVLFVIVDTGMRNVVELSGIKSLFVFLLLPVYMYYDFSGYTDMARGLGRLFGYKLAINFNYPLFAQSISDFWRRWHISLSSWCNDFIFNRLLIKHKKWGMGAFFYAVFATFIVIGLWHGASFNFVILGVLQAVAISVEFLTGKWRKRFWAGQNPVVAHIISSIFIYLFFAVTLLFFFLPGVNDVFVFISAIFSDWHNLSLRGFEIEEYETYVALLFLLFVMVTELIAYIKGVNIAELLPGRRVRNVLYLMVIILVIYFSKYQNVFIYENF